MSLHVEERQAREAPNVEEAMLEMKYQPFSCQSPEIWRFVTTAELCLP